jgi:4-hydroxy-tetrahydrodipicolinate synthase
VEEIPSVCAVKDWSPAQRHEQNIKVLQNLSRPVNVLSTNSAWLMSSLVMGANGLLSGAGSVIADLQVSLFEAVKANDMINAKSVADRIWYTSQVFYSDPFGDMHNRMKEALVLLGRMNRAIVRPPLVKITELEIARIAEALDSAGIVSLETDQKAAE